ncbi:MAG: YIP1 family protein [Chloroflexi bacterium]|nr:YIP1 family protein [Chloroflexota bacterium]
MSQLDNTPIMPSFSGKPGPAGWIQVWIKAVTQPKEQTFVDISESPEMSAKTAYLWVFLAGTISGVIQAFASTIRIAMGLGSQFQIPGMEQYIPQSTGAGGSVGVTLVTGLCASPLAGLFSVIFFALFIAIIQWIAKMFGGTGTYDKLLYAIAAITVPFTIVSSLFVFLSLIPFVGICMSGISILLSIYVLVLQVMAVKGVNRFGWGQAAGSVLLPGCVVFLLCACVVFGGLMLLGPAVSKVFNGINQSLQSVP